MRSTIPFSFHAMSAHSAINSLFVYGTLKQGHLRSNMWPHAPRVIQQGMVRGCLLDLGAYPGLLPGDDWVLGELWTLEASHMARTLEILDEVEGYNATNDQGLYVRRTLPVRLVEPLEESQAAWIDAYTYMISDPDRISAARRIHPAVVIGDTFAASWPDRQSRVPKRLEDE
jgi:gamma-glutamylcyclotransferase (GGCT)/AIG2-like uncharacterized protein YtfP